MATSATNRELSVQINYRWYRLGATRRMSPLTLRKKLREIHSSSYWMAPAAQDSIDSEFKFFSRSEILLEQYDNDGNQFYSRAESVTSVGLSIVEFKDEVLLRVVNPGRGMRHLFSALEQEIGFGFWISPVEFDSNALMSQFDKLDLKRIVGLKLKDVVTSAGWIGRMEFASKEGLDLRELQFLEAMSYRYELVKFELIHKAARGHASVSSGGLVKAGGELWPIIRDLVEKQAFRIARRHSTRN